LPPLDRGIIFSGRGISENNWNAILTAIPGYIRLVISSPPGIIMLKAVDYRGKSGEAGSMGAPGEKSRPRRKRLEEEAQSRR